MIIAVDAMGGDYAPREAVAGAVRSANEDGTQILLVGPNEVVEAEVKRAGGSTGIEIVDAPQVVGMEESAITPIRKKRRSSIRVCAELVRDGRADAMVSAGNTGAALIAAKMIIGTIDGVDRPALAGVFPHMNGWTVLLDVGANIGSRAAHLRQFAIMGHAYAVGMLGIDEPRIGLMSVGEEEGKGTELTREVFRAMEGAAALNFIGNVEGRDVFNGTVDVIVCDGFVGNVVLKSAESLVTFLAAIAREELRNSWRARLGALLAKPAFGALRRRIDYRERGAAPLLGLKAGCFIGHGHSDARTIQNSIRRAVEFTSAGLHVKIRDEVAELHAQEDRLLGSATEEAS